MEFRRVLFRSSVSVGRSTVCLPALNIPSSAGKHTVERLTLTDDKLRLRYEVTVEDPMYLSAPATLTQQWDHRPDLEFSQDVAKCDPEVANRYKDSLPKQ